MVFSIFTKLCSHHHNLIPEHFCHSPKKPPTHQQSLLIPVAPLQTNLFLSLWICLFWTLPINGTFSMWSFVSGFLAYFQGSNILQQISVLRCFVCVCVWPNNFPLYECATLRLSLHKWWTLGCCEHSWAGFCVDMFSFLLGVEPLGHMVTLCLTFWGTSELLSNLNFWP